MYTVKNYKTKKALKEDVMMGKQVEIYAPGLGSPVVNGVEFLEGPHYPAAHTWYAEVVMENGLVKKVS